MRALSVTLTPLQAREILEASPDVNRRRQHQIDLIATAIKEGKWVPTMGTIVLSGDRILDGVQRIAAIAVSDIAVPIVLITDAHNFIETNQ